MQDDLLIAGTTAPAFTLPDVRGGLVSLDEVVRERRAVLVFYRGGWCPICNGQLTKLSAAYERFVERGAEIVAISNERVREGEKVLRSIGPPYPLLLDEGSVVIDRYALAVRRRDPLGWMLRKHRYAHPAVIVVGRDRCVEWTYVGRSYRDRPSVGAILEALEHLPPLASTTKRSESSRP